MHPYQSMDSRAYWRSSVTGRTVYELSELGSPKFKISSGDLVGTGGSCFAQHIGKNLKSRGFSLYDAEPAPSSMNPAEQVENGYSLFSARYGNIYTAAQLLQLVLRATGAFFPKETAWNHEGRFFDPFRPSIPKNGFESADALEADQADHLIAVKEMFEDIDLFVFTLGLTEAWRSKDDGAVYPICPGVKAGTFDPHRYEFVNYSVSEIQADLDRTFSLLHDINPSIRFLLTVSPVALAATATDGHVLTATTYSKAALRAAAGEIAARRNDVSYFPSFEIVSSPVSQGQFFEADGRNVTPAGVECVMNVFFNEYCEAS